MTQSIIVYRNPLEQAFWESGMLFPIMVGIAVFFAVFLTLNALVIERFIPAYSSKRRAPATYAAMAVSAVLAVCVVVKMLG